jgi:uncharacterized protein (TIGR03435 family)
MVQSLLEDRFHLKIHRETKERNVFFLVVGKNGPKLRAVTPDSPNGGIRINRAIQQFLSESEAPPGWSMERMASYLAGRPEVARPVIDKTGLSGLYSFTLEFSMRDGTDDKPIIFAALQEQLGLKLEQGKAPGEVYVIDHVERPTGN